MIKARRRLNIYIRTNASSYESYGFEPVTEGYAVTANTSVFEEFKARIAALEAELYLIRKGRDEPNAKVLPDDCEINDADNSLSEFMESFNVRAGG